MPPRLFNIGKQIIRLSHPLSNRGLRTPIHSPARYLSTKSEKFSSEALQDTSKTIGAVEKIVDLTLPEKLRPFLEEFATKNDFATLKADLDSSVSRIESLITSSAHQTKADLYKFMLGGGGLLGTFILLDRLGLFGGASNTPKNTNPQESNSEQTTTNKPN